MGAITFLAGRLSLDVYHRWVSFAEMRVLFAVMFAPSRKRTICCMLTSVSPYDVCSRRIEASDTVQIRIIQRKEATYRLTSHCIETA